MMGKYELIRKLASGGMAEVFLARAAGPMGFEKKLVVKRILPHLAEDPEFVEMFLAEAKLAAQLSHPNIVQIFDFGDADGTYFLAMEYIDGPNLRVLSERALERGTPIPFPLCAKIISYACEALTYAHDSVDAETGKPLQLIHRDISPDNILLARNGAVKVVDFGIAKAAKQLHQTRVGWIKGKISYMPPEQLKGERLDRRADVYALGVVLYELITAQKPHEADGDVALIQAILHDSITPVKSRRPDVPKELERIVHRALAKDREERYPNCREMQVDLDRFLLDLGETAGAFELSKLVADLQAEPEEQPTRRSSSKATTVPAKGQAKKSAGATVMLPKEEAGDEPGEETESGEDDPPEALVFQARAERRKFGIALVSAALLLLGGVGAYWWLGRPPPVPSVVTRLAKPASPPEEPVSPPEEPVSPPEEPVSPPEEEPSLPPAEPEQAPVVPPVVKKPPARVPEKPLPEPEPEEQPRIVEAPRPAPAAPKLASLKIISEPVAFVRIGKKRGKSPFTAAVPPGEVEVEVYDRERGFSKTARFSLKAGESEVQKVVVGKGALVLRSVPYASVFLDGKALGETPLEQVEAYEGKHTVKFVCPKLKQENVQVIELAPGEKKIVKARYP